MDLLLNNLLKGMSLNGSPDENLAQYTEFIESVDLTDADLMKFLRLMAACVASSKTLNFLTFFFQKRLATGLNLKEFSDLYPSEPDFLLDCLRIITSKHAGSFLELNINATDNNPCTNLPKMEQKMWTKFTMMENLNSINIDQYYFILEDLVEMSKNLPALKNIKVMIDDESRLPISDPEFAKTFRNTFRNLESFIFSTKSLEVAKRVKAFCFFEQFTNFCIKHLPKAREVRSLNFIFDMTDACAEIEQPSLLEYLQLNPSNLEKVASNAEKFPRLVSLFLDWNRGGVFLIPLDKEEWDPLKKFTKLTDLQNCYLEFPEYLEFILSIIGANLNSLQIDYSHQARNDIDLKRIQEYCPKLKQLKMVNNTGVDDNFSFESFTSLLDLQTKFKSGSCKELKLSNFLAAPKLKTVDLNGIQVSRKELRDTIDLIKSKRILTKVNSVILTFDANISSVLKKAIKKEIDSFTTAVRSGRQSEIEVQFNFL